MSERPGAHAPEIDQVKGLAILFVIGIHTKFGDGTIWHEQLVNRAVPTFLFVFGLMSELSLQRAHAKRQSIRDWYLHRIERLIVPVWGVAILFALATLATNPKALTGVGWPWLLTFIGYSPWIGTSWFVTLVLEFVVVFPAIHWAIVRWKPVPILTLALLISGLSAYNALQIVDFGFRHFGNVPPPGWFYFWIFLPRWLWVVVSGVVVARAWGTKPGPRVTAGAVVVSLFVPVALWLVSPEEFIFGALRRTVVMQVWDVPVALAILGIFANVRLPAPVAQPLEWCGRYSWGIYLGHIAVFETMHLLHRIPETGSSMERGLYGGFLLMAGVAIAIAGDAVQRYGRRAIGRIA